MTELLKEVFSNPFLAAQAGFYAGLAVGGVVAVVIIFNWGD